MSSVFQFFKPFDLQSVYDAWTDAPVFDGKKPNAKKGRLDVDSWLSAIQEGCSARKVPKNLWHEVAQHYMGRNAASRFYEVKKVMLHLHGGRFSWNWEKFRTAMHSLKWEIDSKEMMPVRWGRRMASGIWCKIVKKEDVVPISSPHPPSSSTNKVPPFLTRVPRNLAASKCTSEKPPDKPRSTSLNNKNTGSSKISTTEKKSKPENRQSTFSKLLPDTKRYSLDSMKPAQATAQIDVFTKDVSKKSLSAGPLLHTSTSVPGAIPPYCHDPDMHRIAQVPVWLLQTCLSLESLTAEYPKTMSMLAAVLITVGSLPCLPGVAAGAAGAFLASSTAHALGGVALGVGSSLIAARRSQNSATVESNAG